MDSVYNETKHLIERYENISHFDLAFDTSSSPLRSATSAWLDRVPSPVAYCRYTIKRMNNMAYPILPGKP